ncbi:MAG: thiamine diphosphokinase [Candidatus Cloacimonetes bacterium]|nr:thiamine diphosphokinase [Candidatus Cloacimonadota bacterium]MBL7108049.1 thiamine diphosphokinase [Candidatus Cloacimonadota bacterium]
MKKTFIFCNNDYKDFHLDFTKLSGTIIAADGGANFLCEIGIFPHILIGDCDSILPKNLELLEKKSIVKKFPVDKDKSDTELALDYCMKNDFRDIVLINALNGALSHSLANLFLIEKYVENRDINLHFLNRKNEIFVVKNHINLSTEIGSKISLISLTNFVNVEEMSGLKFSLKNEKLFRKSSRGISNKCLEQKVSIKISSGILLVIKAR